MERPGSEVPSTDPEGPRLPSRTRRGGLRVKTRINPDPTISQLLLVHLHSPVFYPPGHARSLSSPGAVIRTRYAATLPPAVVSTNAPYVPGG
jgi:hypothetical protein